MALLPSNIYHKMQAVFAKYEEGKLKGQKERKMTQANIKKALDGQYSCKLYHFKPFQGLQVSKGQGDQGFTYPLLLHNLMTTLFYAAN